jgi:protein tyrosine/serine phosphatase
MLGRHPLAVVDAILRTDPDYIAAAFDGIDAVSGSLDAYLRETLGLHADDIVVIRNTLLE